MSNAHRMGRLSVAAVHTASAEHGPLELDHGHDVIVPARIIERLGPQILSTLYMLVRNVRMYAPENAIFIRPIETLVDAVNSVVAATGSFDLQVDARALIINGAAVKFDFSGLQHLEELARELQLRSVGGFGTDRPINSEEIRAFLAIFTGAPSTAQGTAEEPRLTALKLKPPTKVREILDNEEQAALDRRIDRKKYLITIYARAIQLAEEAISSQSAPSSPFPLAKLSRMMRTLVDFCFDQREGLVGLSRCRTGADSDYRPHHAVNTAILSMLFGLEAGSSKGQLHEIGIAGFLSQIGPPDAAVDESPLWSARTVLQGTSLDKTAARVILGVYESKLPCSYPGIGPNALGLFGRIIAIAERYDALTMVNGASREQAIAAMMSVAGDELDPELLPVFIRAIGPSAFVRCCD